MKIINTCPICGAYCIEKSLDIVEIYNYHHEKLGSILVNDGDIEMIKEGNCPHCENWEDGNGNSI